MNLKIKILTYPYVVKCEDPVTVQGYLGTGKRHTFNVNIGDGFLACKAICDYSVSGFGEALLFFNFNGDVFFFRNEKDIEDVIFLNRFRIMFRSPDTIRTIINSFENDRYTIINETTA